MTIRFVTRAQEMLYAEALSPEAVEDPRVALSPAERGRLLSLAYNCLGAFADSEDVVQEALLRLSETPQSSVNNIEAWLTTVVTRLAIDKLRSAQHQREVYPGEWLPEPVYHAPDAEQQAIALSSLSIGLLYLLERLEPEQRAVFVLREALDYPYQTIAGILGKSEAACRQLMVRARVALDRRASAQAGTQPAVAWALISRFSEALSKGDDVALLSILTDDAIMIADGGGKVPSILNPLYGSDRIHRFYQGLLKKLGKVFAAMPAKVNHEPGLLMFRDGQFVSVVTIEVRGDRIAALYSVSNPDKLCAFQHVR